LPTVTWFGVIPTSEAVPPLGGAVVDAALVVEVDELVLELPPPHAAPTRATAMTTTGSPSPLLSLTSLSLLVMRCYLRRVVPAAPSVSPPRET
jgi:hypothetical protein